MVTAETAEQPNIGRAKLKIRIRLLGGLVGELQFGPSARIFREPKRSSATLPGLSSRRFTVPAIV
jgi:hypothetical protein